MIQISIPLLDETEAQAAAAVVMSGWLSQGPQVAAFETEFANAVGAPHACAVSNCTTALHLALVVAGVGAGSEVITVSHSFIATANAVRQCGATPVFVDIDPRSYNLDPDAIAAAITPRTRAIVCVHQMGLPCDLGRILAVARAHDLPVIEDAACAIGSEIRLDGGWARIGGPHADIACFSFHPRKVITTGEGGMLTTRRADWDRQFRLLRQHGMSVPDTVRHQAQTVVFEDYPVSGFNYRMTDIQAAIGRRQLQRLPHIIMHRRRVADRYARLLAGIPGLRIPTEPEWARSNWQSYCVGLPEGVSQKELMQTLLEAGVATRRGVMCAHLEPAYAGGSSPLPFGAPQLAMPHSERAHHHSILLPLYAQMSDETQDQVVNALLNALAANEAQPSALSHVG